MKTGTDPTDFDATFEVPSHSYPTRFSSVNYNKSKTKIYAKVGSEYPYERPGYMEQFYC